MTSTNNTPIRTGALPGRIFFTVFIAGLIAGALDITAAIATNWLRGIEPMRILQSVATGLLGRDAYQGGTATAALGLLLHFLIMFVIAAVFCVASLRLHALLARHAVMSGVAYGVAVYAFMTFVVLPLSAFPHPFNAEPSSVITAVVVQVLCVGLPIALIARRMLPAP